VDIAAESDLIDGVVLGDRLTAFVVSFGASLNNCTSVRGLMDTHAAIAKQTPTHHERVTPVTSRSPDHARSVGILGLGPLERIW
jgi:hypothetical protein